MVYKNFSKNIGTVIDDTEVADFFRWMFIVVGICTCIKYIANIVIAIVMVVSGKKRKKK